MLPEGNSKFKIQKNHKAIDYMFGYTSKRKNKIKKV